MQRNFLYSVLSAFVFLLSTAGSTCAQEAKTDVWDLNKCITYAKDNSIKVKQMLLELNSSQVDLLKSKSERLPAVNASVAQGFNNSFNSSNTGFSLSTSMNLYSGGAITNGIKKSKLNVELANLNLEETRNDITLSIVQAYLNVLYAKESFDYYKEVVAASQKQVDRARELRRAGSIAQKDLAQLDAQLASDIYSSVVAQNKVFSNTTALKQLLEIPVTDTFNVAFPNVDVNDSLVVLPTLPEALNAALSVRPEIKGSRISTSIAETDLKISKAGYFPSLSLSADYSTSYTPESSVTFGNQFSDNQYKKLGLTLSIPIFNRNATRTSVQQSKIDLERAKLSYTETEKNLLQTVESVYQDAVAAVSRYKSAKIQLESAAESYSLSEQQFNLGMINIVELLDVKTSLLNAKSELVQAKYSVVLNLKILDFYMGKSITL